MFNDNKILSKNLDCNHETSVTIEKADLQVSKSNKTPKCI